jgi:DNA polymerase/3'-5' exonuclease PolX
VDSLAALAEPYRFVAEKRLTEVPGVGDAIADSLAKRHRTRTHQASRNCERELPGGVLKIVATGAKKASAGYVGSRTGPRNTWTSQSLGTSESLTRAKRLERAGGRKDSFWQE